MEEVQADTERIAELEADVAKWKAMSRKHEGQAKASHAALLDAPARGDGKAERLLRTIADLVEDYRR